MTIGTRAVDDGPPLGGNGGNGFSVGPYWVDLKPSRDAMVESLWIAYYEYSGTPTFTARKSAAPANSQAGDVGTDIGPARSGHGSYTQQWLELPFTTPMLFPAGVSTRIGLFCAYSGFAQNGDGNFCRVNAGSFTGVDGTTWSCTGWSQNTNGTFTSGGPFWWGLSYTPPSKDPGVRSRNSAVFGRTGRSRI